MGRYAFLWHFRFYEKEGKERKKERKKERAAAKQQQQMTTTALINNENVSEPQTSLNTGIDKPILSPKPDLSERKANAKATPIQSTWSLIANALSAV